MNFGDLNVIAGLHLRSLLESLAQVRWSKLNPQPPAPPEGGTAEGYDGTLNDYKVLIVHFKSSQREGYDGTLVVLRPSCTIIHLPPEMRQRVFEAAARSVASTN